MELDNSIIHEDFLELYPDFLRNGENVNKYVSVMSRLFETLKSDTSLLKYALKLHRPLHIQKEHTGYDNINDLHIYNYNCYVQLKNIYQVSIYQTYTKYNSIDELLKDKEELILINEKTFTDKGHHYYEYKHQHKHNIKHNPNYYLIVLTHDGTRLCKAYPENDINNPTDPLHNHDKSLDNLGQQLNIRRLNLTTTLNPSNNDLNDYYPPYFIKYDEDEEIIIDYTEDDYYYNNRMIEYIQKLYKNNAGEGNKNLLPVINLWKNYRINTTLKNRHYKLAKQSKEVNNYCSQIEEININDDGELIIINNPLLEEYRLKLTDAKLCKEPATNNEIPSQLTINNELDILQEPDSDQESTGQGSNNYLQACYYDKNTNKKGTYNPCTYELIIPEEPPKNIKPLNNNSFDEDVNKYLPITRQAIPVYIKHHDYNTSLKALTHIELISGGQDILQPEQLITIDETALLINDDGELIITPEQTENTYLPVLQNGVLYQKELKTQNKKQLQITTDLELNLD